MNIQVTLFSIYMSMIEMSRLIVILLMHWQITFLIIILSVFSTNDFAFVRNKAEKQTISFSSDNAEVDNRPFSMEELQDALRSAHDTSAGPDAIHYQLFKQLPSSSLLLLLNMLNKIWLFSEFPCDCRKAIIVILGSSCICKTMDRMINRRLVWYLESHKWLTNV